MNPEIRLAKIQARAEVTKALIDTSKVLVDSALKNPAITTVGGMILINQAYKHKFIDDRQSGLLQAVVVTPAFIQSIGTAANVASGLAALFAAK